MRVFLLISLLMGAAIVFYFSWLPRPNLAIYGVLPDWLSTWTDAQQNQNIRTAVPLLILGLLSGVWLSITKQVWRNWVLSWLLLLAVVSVAEAGQVLIPLRHFDWGDIVCGGIGAGTGLSVVGLVRLSRLLEIKGA
ncbi:hypothetical protein [Spirosoma luteum]|uniref:hypothetical protein n=1 Tax=Spirosoma luteum TaxID=431553 RepID=UPI00036BB954|nr:hypothetical protein [Spirosoma luteum]